MTPAHVRRGRQWAASPVHTMRMQRHTQDPLLLAAPHAGAHCRTLDCGVFGKVVILKHWARRSAACLGDVVQSLAGIVAHTRIRIHQ